MKMKGRQVVLSMTAGSEIRNLNTEESDVDMKYFVLPSFEDLYTSKVFKDFHSTPELDVEVQDVRRLERLIYSSNPAYLDLFFAPDVSAHDYPEMEAMIGMREELARIHLSSLYDATVGMYNRAVSDMMRKTSPLTTAMIEKYGYNTKKFMLALHFLKMLEKYHASGFTDYASAIWYEGDEREFMLKAKRGAFSYEEARSLLDKQVLKIEALKSDFAARTLNQETNEKMQKLLRSLVLTAQEDLHESI